MAKGLLLKPLGDKIVVQRMEADSKTAGGIVLPDSAKEKPQRGMVKAIGAGRLLDNGKRAEMQVAVGNQVIFTAYAGSEVRVNEDEFMVMSESDVLAILE